MNKTVMDEAMIRCIIKYTRIVTVADVLIGIVTIGNFMDTFVF